MLVSELKFVAPKNLILSYFITSFRSFIYWNIDILMVYCKIPCTFLAMWVLWKQHFCGVLWMNSKGIRPHSWRQTQGPTISPPGRWAGLRPSGLIKATPPPSTQCLPPSLQEESRLNYVVRNYVIIVFLLFEHCFLKIRYKHTEIYTCFSLEFPINMTTIVPEGHFYRLFASSIANIICLNQWHYILLLKSCLHLL